MTKEQMYDFLTDADGLGVAEAFMAGAMAIGGFTEDTMKHVLYYFTGYMKFEDYFDFEMVDIDCSQWRG